MPRYIFEHSKTKKQKILDCSFEEMEEFKKKNKKYFQVFSLNIGDSVRLGITQPDSSFQKGVIEPIKRGHPHNTIKSRFKTAREI